MLQAQTEMNMRRGFETNYRGQCYPLVLLCEGARLEELRAENGQQKGFSSLKHQLLDDQKA